MVDGLLMSGLLRITKEEHKIYKELKTRAIEMEKAQMEELKDFEKWKEWKNEPQ